MERQTGQRPKELDPPTEFPILASHIWVAFLSLSKRRTVGMNGNNPLSYRDILDWIEITRLPLEPFEVEMILALDDVYMGVINE